VTKLAKEEEVRVKPKVKGEKGSDEHKSNVTVENGVTIVTLGLTSTFSSSASLDTMFLEAFFSSSQVFKFPDLRVNPSIEEWQVAPFFPLKVKVNQ